MTGRTHPSAIRRFGIGLVTLALAATACTSGGAETQSNSTDPAVDVDSAALTITPETGTEAIAPNTPITVNAENGTISDVKVDQVVADEAATEGDDAPLYEMTGTLNGDGTEWVSDWNLKPGAEVTVTATAENDAGETTELVQEFTTEAAVPGRRLELTHNFPTTGQTVGVGMPIIIGFDMPVTNKAEVENSIKVVSEQGVAGSWRWPDDKTAAFRPEEYWDPYQQISVELHLAGVEASEGVYGVSDHKIDFEVGRELIVTMNVPDHEAVVTVDGEHERTIPVSNGKAARNFDTTSSGVHVLMERYEHLTMDSSTVGIPEGTPGSYKVDVQYAVRTSNSGEFFHEASYNGNIGSANTSNGCTNMRMDDARWFFDNTLMGDVVDTTGTARVKEWYNGWGYWQLSWDEWLSESATGEPQLTDGSGTPGSVHGEQ
ncbi:Ig-like domain-containing protein [Nocardiopsis sp. N85]|uniref:L,D-transpeptidase n=1 Tax=Nocardiopsis sp. N85 TaxID=3029400 RepID=UPI00237F7DCD|nr:Ig-like domain-containing protein [Nocardiopsis sp. N85]MDE3724889.1 Ig-like domain-containing protein [Nocardiopsis sp. N85]